MLNYQRVWLEYIYTRLREAGLGTDGSWFRVHLYNEPKPSRSPVDWPVIEREVHSLKIWCMEMSQHVLDHWSSQNSFYFPADSPTWQRVNPNLKRERLKSQCLCFSFPVLGQAIIGEKYSAWNLAWKKDKTILRLLVHANANSLRRLQIAISVGCTSLSNLCQKWKHLTHAFLVTRCTVEVRKLLRNKSMTSKCLKNFRYHISFVKCSKIIHDPVFVTYRKSLGTQSAELSMITAPAMPTSSSSVDTRRKTWKAQPRNVDGFVGVGVNTHKKHVMWVKE